MGIIVNRRIAKLISAFFVVAIFAVLIFLLVNKYYFADVPTFTTFPVLGCVNDQAHRCLDFTLEESDWGDIKVSPREDYSELITEDQVVFREIEKNSSLSIEIPAFDVDLNGLPNTPLVIEIKYFDNINDDHDHLTNLDRPRISSYIDYPDNKNYELMGLSGTGTENWKTEQALIAKNEFQRIRSIDGHYKFIISTRNLPKLRISYFSVHAISSEEEASFEQAQKEKLNFQKMEHQESSQSFTIDSPYWFTSSPTKPIYPNTVPSEQDVSKSLEKVATSGEMISMAFSVRSPYDLDDINLTYSGLYCNGAAINNSNPKFYKVVNDYKLWRTFVSGGGYGLMPDRIESFDQVDIPANYNQTFWLQLKIPDNLDSCDLNGQVGVKSGADELFDIPISIEILPFKLADSEADYFTYTKSTIKNNQFAMSDIFNHLIKNSITLDSTLVGISMEDGEITGYDLNNLSTLLDKYQDHYLVDRGPLPLWSGSMHVHIKSRLNLNSPIYSENLDDERFIRAYGLLIEQLNDLAETKGMSFVYGVIDEPNKIISRRVIADRLNRIIKEKGSETMSTYHRGCDEEVLGDGISAPEGAVIPSLSNLIDNKIYAFRSIDEQEVTKNSTTMGLYTTYVAHLRNPVYNRFLNGLYANKVGARQVWSYSYNTYINDPYNDFDVGWGQIHPFHYYDFLLSYPTWNNEMLPTLAFESLREGIIDSMYIATLKEAIANHPTSAKSIEAQDYLNRIMDKIEYNFKDSYYDQGDDYGYYKPILTDLSGDEEGYEIFDNIRLNIANYIVDINSQESNSPSVAVNIVSINLAEGQIITSNPYLITVGVDDPAGVEKVEFYANDELIGTTTLPDVDGHFSTSWDISNYESAAIRVVVYDNMGNESEETVNVTVDLLQGVESPIIMILPRTGSGDYLLPSVFGY